MSRKTDAPRTREYVSHDPHTVALLKQDALARLEKWLSGGRIQTRWTNFERRRGEMFRVSLNDLDGRIDGPEGVGFDVSLADAIHAALDQAETKNATE